ncbi:MAG: M23 family metallopeptidase [Holophagales bacterium]|nr:M23 family metallopeptidase [Holophagales bacterium]
MHKGIDIFAAAETPVISAVPGLVIFDGTLGKGGNAVAVLSSGWRIHYYSHLGRSQTSRFSWLSKGETIGTVGTSGNAKGKPPHLHYSILSIVPLPWRATTRAQGWKRMFYLNPHSVLMEEYRR